MHGETTAHGFLGAVGDCSEGHRGRPVDHELQVDAVIGQLYEVSFVEYLGELAGKVGGIFGAHAERDDSAGVAEDRMAHIRFELVQVLVGYREAQSVLAHLGEHVGDRDCREALEFIDVYRAEFSTETGQ
jgi:hypothetical protein